MPEGVLVIGATGRVGVELVNLLASNGESVRAATRTPSSASARLSVPCVEFDFDKPETFGPALDGVGRVFLIARPGDNHADEVGMPFVDTAKREGVGLIVNVTAMGVEQDDTFALRRLERHLEMSGVPYVHLRPNWFMQNFTSGGPMVSGIRASGEIRLPASDAKLSFIDARDIAAVGLAALTEPRHLGKAYTLTGGEALDHYEVARMLSRAAGRAITYVPLSENVACAALRQAGAPDDLINRWAEFYRIVRRGLCTPVTNDVQIALGRPPLAFEQYARQHAAAWR
jgi:uncharacterized protein YbjT (DUF2867 family)